MLIIKIRFILLFLSVSAFSCSSVSVLELGLFPPAGRESILGHDGCSSIELDNNVTMWTFGDTIIGNKDISVTADSTFSIDAKIIAMPGNTAAFSIAPSDDNIKSLRLHYHKEKNRPVEFIKYNKNENLFKWRYWAADGIMLGNKIYVYYMITEIIKEQSVYPFRVRGMGLAEWVKPHNWKIGDNIDFKRTITLFKGEEPTFGDCIYMSDGYLYLIGRAADKKSGITGRTSAYFARVKRGSIAERKQYEFLTGKGEWTSEIENGHPFFHDIIGEPSLSYNKFLKKNVIIYTSLGGTVKIAVFKNFQNLNKAKSYTIYRPKKLKEKSGSIKKYYSGKEIFHTSRGIYAIYINPMNYMPVMIMIPYNLIKHNP